VLCDQKHGGEAERCSLPYTAVSIPVSSCSDFSLNGSSNFSGHSRSTAHPHPQQWKRSAI